MQCSRLRAGGEEKQVSRTPVSDLHGLSRPTCRTPYDTPWSSKKWTARDLGTQASLVLETPSGPCRKRRTGRFSRGGSYSYNRIRHSKQVRQTASGKQFVYEVYITHVCMCAVTCTCIADDGGGGGSCAEDETRSTSSSTCNY